MTNIAAIEQMGGDASDLKAQAAELQQRIDETEPHIAEVQRALSRARECLKWADMAYDGMHWLCLSESRYAGS